jgi:hypothetical protein
VRIKMPKPYFAEAGGLMIVIFGGCWVVVGIGF